MKPRSDKVICQYLELLNQDATRFTGEPFTWLKQRAWACLAIIEKSEWGDDLPDLVAFLEEVPKPFGQTIWDGALEIERIRLVKTLSSKDPPPG